MPRTRTNEREGTRAVLRHTRTSAFKVRVVLDLVRGKPVDEARAILRHSERDAAALVLKLLDSAIANAEHNDGMVPDELYVASAFADEGKTFKTFKPRARGRAGRIRKRTCHITIIVGRLPEDRLSVVKARQEKAEADRRARRVAASQGGRRPRRQDAPVTPAVEEAVVTADAAEEDAEAAEDEGIVDQQAAAIAAADEALVEAAEDEAAEAAEADAEGAPEASAADEESEK